MKDIRKWNVDQASKISENKSDDDVFSLESLDELPFEDLSGATSL